jgi:outer membrane protein assembly factor BamB
MRTWTLLRTAALFLALGVLWFDSATPAAHDSPADRYWPQWRGPHADGTSPTADPPIEWSDTKNVRWKVEVPGRGHSSPIVWGDRVFVTTAVPVNVSGDAQHAPRGGLQPRGGHQFKVIALDRATGQTVWERVANELEPHEAGHPENSSWASSSPFTDGESLFAYFESFGLYAYDMNGTLRWQKILGQKRMRNQFGEGSTPVLHGNTIVIVWDHLNGDGSFIVALDKRDGKELWRVPRPEIDTWATPLALDVDGRAQVIVPGMKRIRSYDLQTGAIVWESAGLTMNPIPSPLYSDGLVFLMSGFQGNALKAVRVANARGNIDGTGAIAWTYDRDTPYVPSPVISAGVLYMLKSNTGILSAFDARTGTPHFQSRRLDDVPEVFSSPVAAAGRVYITGRDGVTLVLRAGPAFELLRKNILGDGFDASPALADRQIFLRGHKYLYALAAN